MMSEKQIHTVICKYIKMQYPNFYFLSDPSGLKMSIGMATSLKRTRSAHAQLDIVILEPSKKYKGLILEVKKAESEVYKKNGEYRENEHVKKQLNSIFHLRDKGYKCVYVFNLQDAIKVLKNYIV